MRILIAEDEPRISRFVARGLKAHGYTPTVVEDGITALDYASSGEFDLLVLDVGLPRMDGFAVLRALRDMGAETITWPNPSASRNCWPASNCERVNAPVAPHSPRRKSVNSVI